MSARPSKKRRLSPTLPVEPLHQPLQALANRDELSDDSESASDANTSTSWADDGDTSGDGAAESEIDDYGEHDPASSSSKPSIVNGAVGAEGPVSSHHNKHQTKDSRVPAESKKNGIGYISETMSRVSYDVQVQDLLRDIKPKNENKELEPEETLRTLKSIIEDLPDIDPAPIETAERNLLISGRVAIPFPQPRPRPDAQYKFAFSKPSYINVVGSYALKTATDIDGPLPVDLVLKMPSDLFTEKDYLNYRYFHKRAFYLACVAAGIQKSKKLKLELRFANLNGSSLLPILVAQPKRSKGAQDSRSAAPKWQINIMLTIEPDLFPRNKILPDKNCVRSTVHADHENQQVSSPTPFYNGSLNVDSSVPTFLKILHSAAAQCPGFRDACYLGRIWLRQRGMSSSIHSGGFGNFEWSSLLAILLQSGGPNGGPVIEKTLSCHHLFSCMVNFLASRNLAKKPLLVRTEPDDSLSLSSDYPVVFDGKAGMNILFKMTPWSYKLLQHEARTAVKILTSNSSERVDSLFILRVSEPLDCYDVIAKVPYSLSKSHFSGKFPPENLQDTFRMLSKGLGDRVSQINMWFSSDDQWHVNNAPPNTSSNQLLFLGIIVDPSHAARTVDRGPAAEDTKAAASFREFWGSKAELRRFKDGQILESVVWNGKSAHDITKEIILYLLHRCLGEKIATSVEFIATDTDLTTRQIQQSSKTLDLVAEFRILESQIRSFEGLPLQVRQIQLGGSQRHNISQIVIQFEGSGRWPDDLTAIQMTKLAFLLKLNELLMDAAGVTRSRIGIENGGSNILNKAFIDVGYTSGAVFRIRIHHDREKTLIENRLANKTLLPREREETARALSAYKRGFVFAPLHAQAMQKLTTRFPTLQDTLRLVHAWFDAHLLSNHIAPEVIDVLTARTFLDPHPWPTPSSVQTGFLRTILFISRWDWQREPFIADFSASMKAGECAAIQTRFEAWRKIDPLMNRVAMFVATDFDPEGTTWTEYAPAKVVAARMKSLAAAASRVVKEKGLELEIGSLFKPGLAHYDFVLRLDRSFTGRKQRGDEKTKFKNLQSPAVAGRHDKEFDPVRLYVQELEALYGDSAVFFHGQGADVVAGVWSPHTEKRNWKVNLSYSTIPIEEGESEEQGGETLSVKINKDAILAEMARLGSDLVASVETRESK